MDRTFHEDARCGSCGGPLDAERDAICFDCFTPDDEAALFAAGAEFMAGFGELVDLGDDD